MIFNRMIKIDYMRDIVGLPSIFCTIMLWLFFTSSAIKLFLFVPISYALIYTFPYVWAHSFFQPRNNFYWIIAVLAAQLVFWSAVYFIFLSK